MEHSSLKFYTVWVRTELCREDWRFVPGCESPQVQVLLVSHHIYRSYSCSWVTTDLEDITAVSEMSRRQSRRHVLVAQQTRARVNAASAHRVSPWKPWRRAADISLTGRTRPPNTQVHARLGRCSSGRTLSHRGSVMSRLDETSFRFVMY